MKNLNFEKGYTNHIFQILAAILHIGNLEFSDKGDDSSQISSTNSCRCIAKLLGLSSPDILEQALCFRENIVNKEIFMIPLTSVKAKDQRYIDIIY